MPGFMGVIGLGERDCFSKETRSRLVRDRTSGASSFLERRTLNKFLKDKPFYEDENYILIIEGVVLNRKKIESDEKKDSFAESIIACYEKSGEAFFRDFRGSFSGILCDKKKETWFIFTNHIGDKQVFYIQTGRALVFGSEMGFVVDYCRRNHIRLTLDEAAAYMLLTYGFFIENHTLANEIQKLNAGHYLKIVHDKLEIKQFHQFRNEPDHKTSKADFIEGIDDLFRTAIKLQFEKDIEYGYRHITGLSGGLDSRMTVWVAHEMGYREMLNTTFSQSNYWDETIAKRIAADLKHEFVFKALDNGLFLKNIDDIAKITYGGAPYYGLAHGKGLYDLLDLDPYGIIHTGQIGDSIIGTFYSEPKSGLRHKIGDGAYSLTLIHRLADYAFVYEYPNQEIFCLYTRAFTGANQGLLDFQEKTESVSPFCNVEFLSFCYTIPVELRYKHGLYFEWILKKYPGAANYIWEKTKRKITEREQIVKLFGKRLPKEHFREVLFKAFLKRIGIHIPRKDLQARVSAPSMNPLDDWYRNNPEIKSFMDHYFEDNVQLVTNHQLKNDCRSLYENGVASEKIQVLTLLSALKLIYN